jgi:hypothetical protein
MYHNDGTFEVLRVVSLKQQVFCGVTPCRFEGRRRLQNHAVQASLVRDHRLSLRFTWSLPYSGMWCSVGWLYEPTFRSYLSVFSTRVKCPRSLQTYLRAQLPHIIPPFSSAAFFLDTWPVKMGPICSPETSVLNQHALRNIPEDGRIQSLHCYAR